MTLLQMALYKTAWNKIKTVPMEITSFQTFQDFGCLWYLHSQCSVFYTFILSNKTQTKMLSWMAKQGIKISYWKLELLMFWVLSDTAILRIKLLSIYQEETIKIRWIGVPTLGSSSRQLSKLWYLSWVEVLS